MPVDRGVIDAQLRDVGEGERWWEVREFRDLPYILHPEERIRGIVNGRLRGQRGPRLLPSTAWLIVATNERLICLRQERFGRKQIEIGAGQIVDVRQRARLRSLQLTIDTAQRKYRIRIPKSDAFRFVGALASLMPPPPLHGGTPPPLNALSWVPGINAVAGLPGFAGIISRVSMLSPPDYATRAAVERLEGTVDRLQADVEGLQQQVQFLENLLHERADEALVRSATER